MSRYLEQQEHVNFTRDSDRAVWNDQGQTEHIGSGSNYISYDPITNDDEGWIIEEEYINANKRGRDLTRWSYGGAQVARDAVGVDGLESGACTITDNLTDFDAGTQYSMQKTISGSTVITAQYFIKKDPDFPHYSSFRHEIYLDGTNIEDYTTFRIDDGQVYEHNLSGFQSHPSSSLDITSQGDWLRVDYIIKDVGTMIGINTEFFPCFTDDLYDVKYNLTGSVIVDMMQVYGGNSQPPQAPIYNEDSVYVTTKRADDVIITDMNAIEYNQDEGTFVIQYKSTKNPSGNGVFELYGDDQNRFGFRHNSDGTDELVLVVGGTTYNVKPTSSAIGDGENVEVRIAYTSSMMKFKVNGSLIGETSIPSFISANEIRVGQFMGEYLNSTLKKFKYYPADIT